MRYSSVSQRFENYFNLIIIVSFVSDIGGKKIPSNRLTEIL